MSKYISQEMLDKEARLMLRPDSDGVLNYAINLLSFIDSLPFEEIEPSVQSYWIKDENWRKAPHHREEPRSFVRFIKCANCKSKSTEYLSDKATYSIAPNYCHCCGAKMKKSNTHFVWDNYDRFTEKKGVE